MIVGIGKFPAIGWQIVACWSHTIALPSMPLCPMCRLCYRSIPLGMRVSSKNMVNTYHLPRLVQQFLQGSRAGPISTSKTYFLAGFSWYHRGFDLS